jgi:hypothetical protein
LDKEVEKLLFTSLMQKDQSFHIENILEGNQVGIISWTFDAKEAEVCPWSTTIALLLKKDYTL